MIRGFNKIKNRNRLGIPPSPEEASQNLKAPETAPYIEKLPNFSNKVDGRSFRRTGRILQFATKVSEEFDSKLRKLAQQENLLIIEVLERALEQYEKTLHKR